MCQFRRFVVIFAALLIGCGDKPSPQPPAPPVVEIVDIDAKSAVADPKPRKRAMTDDQILFMLSRFEPYPNWKDDYIYADDRTISVLERLAADPTTEAQHVASIFGGAYYIEGGQKRFIPHGIKRVADHDRRTRSSAFGFLCDQNVDHTICSILATGLYDEKDQSLFWSAGLGLVKHGGENEVLVFEVWLRQHGDRPELKKNFEFVAKCRDQLFDRLKAEKLKK